MVSEESLVWIKALQLFYKTGNLEDLPPNADRNNPYVFDALKKWKLLKKIKQTESVSE